MTKATRQKAESGTSSSPASRRADQSVGLTRESIVTTALEVSQRQGPGALTLRRLGTELGVDATAVYRHFRDKDEIVLACLDQVIALSYAEVRARVDDEDWRRIFTEVAWSSWRMSETYSAIYSLAFARTTGGPGERRMVDFLLGRLSQIDLPPGQTVLLYRLFVDSVLSMCGMRAAMLCLPAELAEKDATAWSRIYAVLPQEQYPAARRHAGAMADVTDEELYGALVDTLINAIATAEQAQELAGQGRRNARRMTD